MAPRRYLNFDLLLDQEADGHYQALVTGSPLGETPSVRFRLPFDATTLENLLLKLDPGRSGTRRVAGNSRQQAAMDFGGPLYSAIFREGLLLAWTRSLDTAREEGAGLRLRLRLADAPAIAGLPWELLYDVRSNCFFAQSERTPVVRFLEVSHVPRPMSVDGPLRILVVVSSPADLEPLDVEGEWQRIEQALTPRIEAGLVALDRLPEPSVNALGLWLRQHETHVVHMVGHGDFNQSLGEGVVYFQDRHGRSTAVSSSVLGPFLRDHDPLRLVVLNACRSARADAVDPYGGMAQGLVQQDATAVLAMQFPITDRAAVSFTEAFYGALVDGLPVDQATSSARKALLADHRDEWATPVLFMRSPDGYIFANVHAIAIPGDDAGLPPVSEDEGAVEQSPEHEVTPEPPDSKVATVDRSNQPDHQADLVGRSRRWPLVLTGLVGVLVAVGVIVFVPRLFDETSDPVPTAGLPQSAPLRDTQILLGAGDEPGSQNVWLADVGGDSSSSVRLTTGVSQEWLPSISPDRRTMVFSRAAAGVAAPFELWIAEAGTGSDERRVFQQGTPDECKRGISRPAWLPDERGHLAAMCVDGDDQRRLVVFDTSGEVIDDLGSGTSDVLSFGDPTVSSDGRSVIVWASPEVDASGGSLYAIDLLTGSWREVLEGEGQQYSDPAFSPEGDLIAYRDDAGGGNFQIAVATVARGKLVDPHRIVTSPGRDQDPMFSPDGSQIVYGHVEPGQVGATQELWIIDAAGETSPTPLAASGLPAYQTVPAWSRR